MAEDPHTQAGRPGAVRPSPLRLTVLVLAVALLGVLALTAPLLDWTRALYHHLDALGWRGGALFVLCFALWNLVLPSSPLQLLAGVVYGLALGSVLVYAGAAIGVIVGYGLARQLGRDSVESLVGRWPLWRVVDRSIARSGWRGVLLLRLSNVLPANVINLLLGISPLPLGTVLWASLLGKLPGILLAVGVGRAGRPLLLEGRMPSLDVWSWMMIGIGIAATVALLAMIARAARREMAMYKQEEGQEGEGAARQLVEQD